MYDLKPIAVARERAAKRVLKRIDIGAGPVHEPEHDLLGPIW